MCATCGCSADSTPRLTVPANDGQLADHHPDDLHHPADLPLAADHDAGPADTDRTVVLEQQILAKNAALARHNRDSLAGRGIFAVNLMSSPGSGKTTLLERTIRELRGEVEIGVIEGDQETPLDAERIRAAGRPFVEINTVQINTGSGCHLDARMVHDAVHTLDPAPDSLLFIENVGNLVCPALFDLGESARVVMISVPEGADKPLKYPHMFRGADLVLINKIDLLPYVDFDLHRFDGFLRRINPAVPVLTVTATSEIGLQPWLQWCRQGLRSDTESPARLDSVSLSI